MHDQQLVTIFKALADKTRLDIVRTLAHEAEGSSCRELCNYSSLSQPTMSHHLGKLVHANIIIEHKSGKEKLYELNIELLQAYGINTDLL